MITVFLSSINTKKIGFLYLLVLLLLVPTVVPAQMRTAGRTPSEIYLRAGGGMAGLNYSVTGGHSNSTAGWQGGAGITLMLHRNWGAGVGIELASYRTQAALNSGLTMATPVDYASGNLLEWRITADGYEETQTAYLVQLPIVLHYQLPVADAVSVYANAGLKIGLPVSTRYKASATVMTTSGYSSVTGEIIDDPLNGFGTLTGWQSNGSLSLDAAYIVTAELGVKWPVSGNTYLYTGLYFDYGTNNMAREGGTVLIDYLPADIQTNHTGHTLLQSSMLVNSISTLAVGFNLRLAFGVDFNQQRNLLSKTRYYSCPCR